MTRKVIHTGKGPVEIKLHKKTLDEKDDKIYEYDKKGNRIVTDCCKEDNSDKDSCCGGSSCCGGDDCCAEK